MGIDRIGKGGAPPNIEGASSSVGGVAKSEFSVAEKTEAASGVDPASPLARLQSGEIDVNGYVDLKVDEATRGLVGLSPTELDDIKRVLRDQIATDPGLSDLVRTASGGSAPSIPEE